MKKILKSKDDAKEVKSKYNELEDKKATVRKIREKFHSYIRKCGATVEDGRALSEAMQEYSTTLLGNHKSSVLGSCLFEAAQMQKFMEDATTDLCSYSLKSLDAPFEGFIAREAENAQSIKKRYDKTRSSLDSLKSEVEDSEQHSRVVELADEAVEQLKQVDAAFDLHALGFASRYLAAIHTSCVHLAQRSAQALSVLEQYSSSHFEDEVDQHEVDTGRPFTSFSNVFSPPWADHNLAKRTNTVGISLHEARKREISELLKRERLYVDILKSLVKIYLFEFRNNRQVTKVVTLQDLDDLFCNIEEILDLHQDFMWDLQAALEPPFDTSLAELLLEFIPKLEPYSKYVANASKSVDTLSRLLRDKRCVTTAIKQCSEKDSSGRSFIDLLQMPLGHIKMYKTFVEQALERTPTSSEDYDPIDDVLSLVLLMDDKIAAANISSGQYQALLAMAKRVEGGEELVTSNPSRKFIKDSPATTLESSVTLLLFSDLLLVCIDAENNGYSVRRRVTLCNVLNAVVAGGSTVQIEISQEPPLAFSLPSYFEAQKWVDEVKNALQSLFTTKVFGVPLAELMTKHEKEQLNDIPSFIAEALDTIDATGIEMEGIFRVSGSVLAIRGIKDAINQGIPVDYRSLDIHSVAGMVQTWIRELPEPLLTYNLYNEWIGHTAKGLEAGPLRATVGRLPPYHRFMLQHLCQFLNRVSSFGKVNKMRSGNLAIVFGPSLLCERSAGASGDQTVQEKDGPLVQVLSFASVHLRDVYQVVQFLIENYKEVFEGVEEEREKFKEKLKQQKLSTHQSTGNSHRAEQRKAIKEKRMNDERSKAEIAAASDPAMVKKAEERRQARRDERERVMREEKEKQEIEKKRLEDEEKAQIELVKKQRAEAEEQKRIERQKKEVDDIEKRFADSQTKMQEEEDRAREIRKQRAQDEKERQEEAEFKAREAAKVQRAKEREQQEAIARAEEEQQRIQQEREKEEARKKEEALPSCSVCGKKVQDGVVSKERGLAWHSECYKCVECQTTINLGVGSNNTLVCSDCGQKKKVASGSGASDGCPICGKPLSGRVVRMGDKRIHKACFVCEQCSGSLDDGYYEVKGKTVCENCAK